MKIENWSFWSFCSWFSFCCRIFTWYQWNHNQHQWNHHWKKQFQNKFHGADIRDNQQWYWPVQRKFGKYVFEDIKHYKYLSCIWLSLVKSVSIEYYLSLQADSMNGCVFLYAEYRKRGVLRTQNYFGLVLKNFLTHNLLVVSIMVRI